MDSKAEAICGCLIDSPLLIGEIDAVGPFDRALFGSLPRDINLNYNQKLGHLYEQALGVLIDSSERLDLVARNLQVFDSGGRTIGELDFVLQDVASGRYIHLELAIKFYLAVRHSEGWEFPGPDPKDNWSRKLERMRAHQWKLCERLETRALLLERLGINAITTEHLVLGRIYTPDDEDGALMPDEILDASGQGRWLYVSQFEQLLGRISEVCLVEKSLWLVDPNSRLFDSLPLISTDELRERATERCVMFRFAESSDSWFLVPDSWPEVG